MEHPAIYSVTWGECGPTVVMVHGSAQGSEVGGERHFAAQSRLAERGWQVIVPDRPGHGRSPAPGRPDDSEADGEWVADLLGESAHLVGHSFGGCVALAAAARRPAAVRSLTLIEPAMHILAIADPRVQAFQQRLKDVHAGVSAPAEQAIKFAKLVGIPDEIRGGSGPAELARMGKGLAQLKLPTEAMLRQNLETIKRADIPLLVISGGSNPAFDAVGETLAGLGNGRFAIIRSEHHFPQLVSDEFNHMLAGFMTEADRRRQPSAGSALHHAD